MEATVQQVIEYLEHLAQSIPLPFFAFIGSIIDEIFAPLPSPFVPITSGSLTYEQGLGFMFLFVVAFAGTLGKTLATFLTYWVADKFEDYLTHSKLGSILGVDEAEIEKYGKFLDGTRKDDVIMIFLRALPFIPTLPVSVIAGLIKLNLWTYVWTTFVGTYIRFMFYLILAYEGVRKYSGLIAMIDTTGSIVRVTLILGCFSFLYLFLRKRWDRIVGFFFKKRDLPVEAKDGAKKKRRSKKSK
ncbi:MAG: transmembrane protein [Microgenomates bacterium 39_7]|nr:MAG: transmembrane protein [Microgenomates bacterium 39_7]